MGQVIIELPQAVNRTYRIEDVEASEKLLRDLEKFEQKPKKERGVIPPRRERLKEDGDKVLGIWADRQESAEEIACQIRENNRKVT